jgi:hypothetical protein
MVSVSKLGEEISAGNNRDTSLQTSRYRLRTSVLVSEPTAAQVWQIGSGGGDITFLHQATIPFVLSCLKQFSSAWI